jgi:hypothetical protein
MTDEENLINFGSYSQLTKNYLTLGISSLFQVGQTATILFT